MSEDALQQIQDLIRYCPVCGEESTKHFDNYTTHSGEWTCLACEEIIDVLLVDYEEDEEAEEPGPSALPFIVMLICLIALFYFSTT